METDERERWKAWKLKTFDTDYMIWHDGLYTGAVTDLVGPAREEALTMLRLGVSLGDSHASEALAAMKDTASLDSMVAELAKASGAERVRIALAIHALSPDPALSAELIAVLQGPDHWSTRIDAAIGLREFRGAVDESALLDSIEKDPDYLVRYHSGESLLVRWNINPPDLSKHDGIFGLLVTSEDKELTPEDFAKFKKARELLQALKK
ncbi:MAG: hypothetical protein JNM63_06030 [Spirochaetia bacterium]|nr:hypothetical protein [Spirochaetia bacterium]